MSEHFCPECGNGHLRLDPPDPAASYPVLRDALGSIVRRWENGLGGDAAMGYVRAALAHPEAWTDVPGQGDKQFLVGTAHRSQPVLREALDRGRFREAAQNVNERERLMDGSWTIERIADAFADEYDRLAHPTSSPEDKE